MRFKVEWTPGANSQVTLDLTAGEEGKQVQVKMNLNGSVEDVHIDDALQGDLVQIAQLMKEATTQGAISANHLKRAVGTEIYDQRNITDLLPIVAPESMAQYQKYYLDDDIITKEQMNPPPVKKLLAVYGVNCETEMFQFYKKRVHRKGKNAEVFELDSKGSIPNFKCVGGIGYETPSTLQIQPDTGEEVQISGDHTVPYCSLRYCMTWQNLPGFNVDVREIEKVTHRGILSSEQLHDVLLDYVCRSPETLFHGQFDMAVDSVKDIPGHEKEVLLVEAVIGTAEKPAQTWTAALSLAENGARKCSLTFQEHVSVFNQVTFSVVTEKREVIATGLLTMAGKADGQEHLEPVLLQPVGTLTASYKIITPRKGKAKGLV